jgi:hypothetical protein
MTEHQIQCEIVRLARALSGRYPCLGLLFAIPNGGARNPITGAQLKREGVRAGVPDLFLPAEGAHGQHGLFLEVKTSVGRLSLEQKEWFHALPAMGYECIIVRSGEGFIAAIEEYLDLQIKRS